MPESLAVHGQEIIDLIESHPDGIRLGLLMEAVEERYGRMVTFHNGATHGMTLDDLLRFLEERDKARITGGVVRPLE